MENKQICVVNKYAGSKEINGQNRGTCISEFP